MRWRLFAWVIVSAVVAAGGVTYALMRDGVSARQGLSPFEEQVLYRIRMSAIAADAPEQVNPYRGSVEVWTRGAHHFVEECAPCHGAAGRGDGKLGVNMFPQAPDLTASATQRLSDGQLYHIISQGIRMTGMPALDEDESPEETWALVSLVRRLDSLDADAIARAASSSDDELRDSPVR